MWVIYLICFLFFFLGFISSLLFGNTKNELDVLCELKTFVVTL